MGRDDSNMERRVSGDTAITFVGIGFVSPEEKTIASLSLPMYGIAELRNAQLRRDVKLVRGGFFSVVGCD